MKTSSWATTVKRLAARGELVRARWPVAFTGLAPSSGIGTRTGMLAHKAPLRETSRMDITWVIDRIAVGGGIWTADNMAAVARAGVTHIIDMQIEFDDTGLAEPHGIEVLWNPIDDDFQPKPPEILQRGVDFATEALDGDGTRLFIHCAAGVHRAPMMTLAVLCSMGWTQEAAQDLIEKRRPVVDFADVYVRSVERFLDQQVRAGE
jgi:protein-tyrosine phosphatase